MLQAHSCSAGSGRVGCPGVRVRPAAVDYGDHADVVGWHSGERGMANFKRVLGNRGTIPVTVRLLDPLPPTDDRKAMARHDGNVSQAAKALGLSRSALYRRLQHYGL